MSQFGMNMPGGRQQRSASMNVYTGLLFAAVVAMAVAAGFMWVAASKVGLDASPFKLQEAGRITLPAAAPGRR